MKKCPVCGQFFSDDNLFCVSDGATLTEASNAAPNRVVIPIADEQPTQVFTPPPVFTPPVKQIPTAQPSNGLYVVIGILITIIVAMGAGFLFLQNREASVSTKNSTEKSDVKNDNRSSDTPNAAAASTPSNLNVQKMDDASNASSVQTRNAPPAANKGSTSVSRRFDTTYEGTVNADAIEMRLVRKGGSLSGKVIPKYRYADISVSGTIDDDGSFEMTEYSDLGAITGMYRGRIQPDDTITGNWSKPDGSKTRPLYLKAK